MNLKSISFNRIDDGYSRTTKMEAQSMSGDIPERKSFIELWKTFPQSLKDTICKYLDFVDILNASLVCKAFYEELGYSPTAMSKIKFRVQADWSQEVGTMLENSCRSYTFIHIYSDGGPRTTIQFFKNYPHWTHADLESIQFSNGEEWINYVKSLPRHSLCYDKVEMPLMWYRNFFRAQSNLISLKIKWLRKDVLKSAVKMLSNLREIHYEKFYDLVESDDDEEEDLYANDKSEGDDEFEEIKDLREYYELIKKSLMSVNKNVQISKRTIRNKFIHKN